LYFRVPCPLLLKLFIAATIICVQLFNMFCYIIIVLLIAAHRHWTATRRPLAWRQTTKRVCCSSPTPLSSQPSRCSCVCMCVGICMYIFSCVCILLCVCLCVYVCVCMCVHVCGYMYVHLVVCKFVCACSYVGWSDGWRTQHCISQTHTGNQACNSVRPLYLLHSLLFLNLSFVHVYTKNVQHLVEVTCGSWPHSF
jgi:hypothetical protein